MEGSPRGAKTPGEKDDIEEADSKGHLSKHACLGSILGAAPFKEQHKADEVAANASCSHEDVEDGKHDVAVGEPIECLADDEDNARRCDADHTTKLV